MNRLDSQMRAKCLAVGLDVDEMEQLFVESGARISPVLVRISSAEAEMVRVRAEARAAAAAAGVRPGVGSSGWRRQHGPSALLSIRLDHDELAELRARAERSGYGVSVLARAYIRRGLSDGAGVRQDPAP